MKCLNEMLTSLPKNCMRISSFPNKRSSLEYYASLIETCTSTKNPKKLNVIHARVLVIGIHHEECIRAKLISSYATCKQMHEAAYIFGVTNPRSIFLYNSMISGYASLNDFRNSINIYHEMLVDGKQPDQYTLPAVLRSCAGLSALHLGHRLHVSVVVSGLSTNVETSNALVTMYSECGDSSSARKVFDQMLDNNLIISDRVKHTMRISSFSNKHSSLAYYAYLIETCTSTKNLKKLKEIHAQVLLIGIHHKDFIRAKLISSYATCKQMHEAAYIFSFTNRQPTFLYNSMIRGYASLKHFHNSINIYHEMRLDGKQPDQHTLPAVLRSCAGLSALHLGRGLHVLVVVSGFSNNVATSNALITMYSKCGDLSSARKVFDQMLDRNVITWSAMISGYGMNRDSSEVFELFQQMLDVGESPDAVMFTAVLSACSHCGLADMGRGFFEMMEWRFGLKPGLEHYTCMAGMLGKAGHVEEAEELLSRIDVEPDDALWRVLLGACNLHGKMEVAERVAEKLYGKLTCN